MKALKLFLGGASILALLALGACKDDVEPNDEPEQEYDDSYWAGLATISSENPYYTSTTDGGMIEFKSAGGEVVISVSCGTEWIVENTATDLFDATANVSSGTLTVSAGQNYVTKELSGTITLSTAAQRVKFAVITVSQGAYGAPEITVDKNVWHAPAVGELTTEVAVESNIDDWTVENTADWLTVETTETGLTITAAENDSEEEREAKIVLVADDGYKSDSETIAVVQDGKAYIKTSLESLPFYEEAEYLPVEVESNYDWDFSYDTSLGWLTVERDGNTLTVTVTEKGTDDRDATITITAGNEYGTYAEVEIPVTQTASKTGTLLLSYYASTPGTEITLPLAGTVDCTVDWRDGTVETVTSAAPTHTLPLAGLYKIRIDGTVTALNSKDFTTKTERNTTLISVDQWGLTGLTDMQYAFYYYSNLSSLPSTTPESALADVTSFYAAFYYDSSLAALPADLFKYCTKLTDLGFAFDNTTSLKEIPSGLFDNCPDVTSLRCAFIYSGIEAVPTGLFNKFENVTTAYQAFYGCSSLKSLPDNMFSGCKKLETVEACFAYCTSLTELPESLFAGCSTVTTFEFVFYNCTGIESVPGGIFKDCTAATNFGEAFYQCTSLKTLPSELFYYNTEVPDFEYTFYGCKALESIPAGLFEKNTKVTSFAACFYQCTSLTAIPEHLFDNNTEVSDMEWTFYGCTSLVTIPEELFYNLTKITNFAMCFYLCSSLVTVPENLFAKNTEVTSFLGTFHQCYSFETIPEKLFANNAKVTTFQETFYQCTPLKEIPENLFVNNTEVTNFSWCFYKCTALTSVPENLFAKNTEVTNFAYLFQGCTALENVPAGLFANNTKVTNFTQTFYQNVALLSVPATLFANNTEVTKFDSVLNTCSILSIPENLFANCKKVTSFTSSFKGSSDLTGESAYDVVDGVKIHIYERTADNGYTVPTSYSNCYTSCTGLSDYSSIPSGWGGGATTSSLSTYEPLESIEFETHRTVICASL